ncbi:MAG: hypothetical protein SCM57_04740 [Bacillota bacterium]|nr:hypothetical protein [Bacillota bacterium]
MRYRRTLFYFVLLGLFLGAVTSGAWQRTPYYEPVRTVPQGSSPDAAVSPGENSTTAVPEKKRFLFLPLPWRVTAEPVVPREDTDGAETQDDMEQLLRETIGTNLTLREQLAVMRIVLTRLNSEERGQLLELSRGNVTMDEAFAAYRMLRERLTEEEMVLVFGLMKKYRSELEELIRK